MIKIKYKIFGLFALSVSLLIFSCENDQDFIKETSQSQHKDLPISVVTTNYQEVGEKFRKISNDYQLDSHRQMMMHGDVQQKSNTNGIVIISPVVKEITQGDYTSYTMLIEPIDITSTTFYNLTIEEKDEITKMFITKYKPTPEWINNPNIAFGGEVTTFRIYDLSIPLDQIDTPSSGQNGGGSTSYPTDCDGTVVSTVIINEIRCGCGHTWDEYINGICDGCKNIFPQFPSLEFTTVYECVPNSPPPSGNPFTNPPGGTPGTSNPPNTGGGSSSGGNTTTSPAGNNNSLTAPLPPKDGTTGTSVPCGLLKNLLQSIKPSVESLITTLNQPGENGITFEKDSNGVTQNNIIPNSYGRMLAMKIKTNTYGYIHTHPFSTYPMFSWGDVLTLSQIYQNAQPHNKENVTIMLAAKADDGVTNLVYALTISNPQLFNGIMNETMSNPEFNSCTDFDKNKILSEPLDNRFFNQSTTNEQDFLRTFYNQGIDLWKANSTLTSWTKLSLNPLNMQLTETPCN